MSSITIIAAIIVLLATLVCYAFITQTIAQKKQQRERLLVALRSRIRNFKFILGGFPAGFLPRELTLLVQRSLMQLLEQLSKLEPAEESHREDLQSIAQQMAETQRQSSSAEAPYIPIDNGQKIREIKACLEELYKFIFHLESKQQLNHKQVDLYQRMIKLLVLQLAVDSYVLHGKIAADKDKPRLAIHYFDLAIKLLIKERSNHQNESRITQLRALISEQETMLTSEKAQIEEPKEDDESNAISSEWDKFAKDQNWKKKQIYD